MSPAVDPTGPDLVTRALFGAGLELLNRESAPGDFQSFFARLGVGLQAASPLDKELARRAIETHFAEIGVADPRRLVAAGLSQTNGRGHGGARPDLAGQESAVADPEPWPEPLDGAELLDTVGRFVRRFLILPPGADRLLAAFTLHTYVAGTCDTATYVAVHSPVPQCGKTRVLEVLELLAWRPWRTAVVSTAVLFRKLQQDQPTLLLDEAEVVRGKGEAADNVRALLNAGYRRGGFVDRCVGDQHDLRKFSVFGPKVFAVIGSLPAALFDRCVVLEMQRKQRGEKVERFRPRRLEAEAALLRRQLRRWAEDHREALVSAEPPLPEFLDDREQETWEPLLAIGAIAGAGWYEALVAAARTLAEARQDGEGVGIRLLADVREALTQVERLPSADLARALNALEGRPWADWNRGKGLTPNVLARLLKPFGVAPGNLRTSDGVAKGYRADQFAEAFERYLPRTATATPTATHFPAPQLDCSGVAVARGGTEGEGRDAELDLDALAEREAIQAEAADSPPAELLREWVEAPVGEYPDEADAL